MLLAPLALIAVALGGIGPYSGLVGQTTVAPPRLDDAGVTIDGTLGERVWSEAAVLTGFSEYSPVDGRPAEDSTAVLVWYSARAIYFGIRAFERHGSSLAEERAFAFRGIRRLADGFFAKVSICSACDTLGRSKSVGE